MKICETDGMLLQLGLRRWGISVIWCEDSQAEMPLCPFADVADTLKILKIESGKF